jgi:hypothetical protein
MARASRATASPQKEVGKVKRWLDKQGVAKRASDQQTDGEFARFTFSRGWAHLAKIIVG